MRCVLYTATRNFYQDMTVSMKSLLSHTPVDKVYCFIEDDTFPYELPGIVKTINVRNQDVLDLKRGKNLKNPYSWIVMFRAVAFELINEEKILSIDTDTIVRGDIGPLLDMDVNDCYYAAVQEDHSNLCNIFPYYNIGVALLNLTKIREKRQLIIDLLNNAVLPCIEQDVLLITCREAIKRLPSKYNATYCTEPCREEDIIIRHYVGHEKKELMYSSEEYRRYLFMPWKNVKYLRREDERG